MYMELKQADIFGGYKIITKKTNNRRVPRRKKYQEVKEKIEILYKLYEKLYGVFNINILEQREMITGILGENIILIYPEDKQAEPIDLANYSIYDLDIRINRMKEVLDNVKTNRINSAEFSRINI